MSLILFLLRGSRNTALAVFPHRGKGFSPLTKCLTQAGMFPGVDRGHRQRALARNMETQCSHTEKRWLAGAEKEEKRQTSLGPEWKGVGLSNGAETKGAQREAAVWVSFPPFHATSRAR